MNSNIDLAAIYMETINLSDLCFKGDAYVQFTIAQEDADNKKEDKPNNKANIIASGIVNKLGEWAARIAGFILGLFVKIANFISKVIIRVKALITNSRYKKLAEVLNGHESKKLGDILVPGYKEKYTDAKYIKMDDVSKLVKEIKIYIEDMEKRLYLDITDVGDYGDFKERYKGLFDKLVVENLNDTFMKEKVLDMTFKEAKEEMKKFIQFLKSNELNTIIDRGKRAGKLITGRAEKIKKILPEMGESVTEETYSKWRLNVTALKAVGIAFAKLSSIFNTRIITMLGHNMRAYNAWFLLTDSKKANLELDTKQIENKKEES